MTPLRYQPDPRLDLVLERIVDVPPELVWKAWTSPEHLKPWFTPAPWHTVDCEIDLRPGGMFRTVMRSPEGQEFPHMGCYLEIVTNQKLVWTNACCQAIGPPPSPLRMWQPVTHFSLRPSCSSNGIRKGPSIRRS